MVPDSILYPGEKPGTIFVVDKTRQELRIYSHDGKGNLFLEKVIPCSTGMVRGDKLVRGDKKTPDGYYIFNQKLLPSELPEIYGILAYPMDYPNFWDHKVGRKGDGIWIHGVNKPLVDYDSAGCVELLNHDLAALEDTINLYDTPILLSEEMTYAPAEELRREGRKVLAFAEKWRKAWSEKDLQTYSSLYAENFHNNDNMSREAWMNHKRNVARGYKKIDIKLDDLRSFRHRDVVVVSFVQRYQGDGRYSSVGVKRLYLKPSGDSFLIVAEDFSSMPRPDNRKRLSPEEKLAALTTPPLSVASFSEPVVTASAGALIPGSETLFAEASTPSFFDATKDVPKDAGQSALEAESERAALEARVKGLPPARTSEEEPPLEVARNDLPSESRGLSTVTGSLAGDGPGTVSGAAEAERTPAPATGIRTAGGLTVTLTSASKAPAAAEAVSEIGATGATASTGAAAPATKTSPDIPKDSPKEAAKDAPADDDVILTASADLPQTAKASPAPAVPPAPPAPAVPTAAESEAAILNLLGGWERAWEAKDEKTFFSYYGEGFRYPDKNMGREAFVRYRGRLMRSASVIEVELKNPRVRLKGTDRAEISFTQNYRSDNFRDTGTKTLTLARNGDGNWRITAETFEVST
ncbi:MAG: L,D-transpeptidase family protein [Deltaproteobacteria bacterium]|jgi:murein L,D-transpeptidase YafK|nr:L,D-transpeptidase family protein [Deltaproteobacteria bacterium]